MGDGTFDFAARDIALLGMDLMTPGGKLRLLTLFSCPLKVHAEAVHMCTRKPGPVAKSTVKGAVVAGSPFESGGDEPEEAKSSLHYLPLCTV